MHRMVRRLLFASVGLLVVLGGTAAAAAWYDGAHRDRLLPGVTVGGIDAGGKPAAAIVQALDAELPPIGATALRVTAGPARTTLTLSDLGLRSDAAESVARARAEADRMGVLGRVWHHLLDKPVERHYPVRLQVSRAEVERAVLRLSKQVQLDPVDARIDTSSGMVSILPAARGRTLDVAAATERVHAAAVDVANGTRTDVEVSAPVRALEPRIKGFDDVILVRVAENKLYHYDNGVLAKTYSVATGTARYPTPKGNFSVVLKRRNPTWVNPDPRGWGRSLPARIGPGPRNPLGTRALNLDAPGIRIHGTANVASLGTPASHGCIRMAMPDIEELFDKVEQGTPVAIIQGPPPPTPVPPVPGAAPVPAAPASPVATIGDPDSPVDLEAG
ncbi:MAG: L,D-transpeptidase family protein [Actinomycetota bacterium]